MQNFPQNEFQNCIVHNLKLCKSQSSAETYFLFEIYQYFDHELNIIKTKRGEKENVWK